MPKLEPLQLSHAGTVLAFERDNREFFTAAISDRGDQFFEQFAARFQDLLADQDAGDCAFFVLVDDDGEVIGRFNLYDLEDASARVGYRVAQRATGQGLATEAVCELCQIASSMGLHTLTAVTAHDNIASQKVLLKAGFVPAGAADPAEVGGKPGVRFRRVAALS